MQWVPIGVKVPDAVFLAPFPINVIRAHLALLLSILTVHLRAPTSVLLLLVRVRETLIREMAPGVLRLIISLRGVGLAIYYPAPMLLLIVNLGPLPLPANLLVSIRVFRESNIRLTILGEMITRFPSAVAVLLSPPPVATLMLHMFLPLQAMAMDPLAVRLPSDLGRD